MKTGKIGIKHIAVILLVAAGIISLCALGISRQTAVNSEISKYDNTDLTSLIIAYDNEGNEILPKKVDEQTYDGYTFKLKSDTPDKYITEKAIKNSAIKEIGGDNFYSAKSLEAIDDFISEEYIEYIEPDYTVTVSDNFYTEDNVANPNDVTDNQWNLNMMNVQQAWEQGIYGQPAYDREEENKVTVAVIDSGLYGSGEADTTKHEDIDYSKVVSGTNLVTTAKGTPDTMGHGTFVSGMIFARMNNGVGIAGIAPEVNIVPIKVFGSAGKTSNSTVESAIYEAVDRGVDVINMSLGAAGYSVSLKSACDAAEAAGVLVVAAAGNDGTSVNNYPAAYDNVVGVGSVDSDGGTSYFSQYGDSVYVAAPGGLVYSLGLGESSYKTGSGTSYASPEVAALAAMVKSIAPEMTQTDFKKLLERTSQDKGAEGFDDYYGWGIVDFGETVKAVLEQKYLPIYNVKLEVTDKNGIAINDAKVTVKAAEDISWKDDPNNNISAGSMKKGTVVNSENGVYKLHKGEYAYTVSREGYRTVESTFVTSMRDQTVAVVLEKTYSVSIVPQDSECNILDEAEINLTRKGDGLKISITQNSSGRYQDLIPEGTYNYTANAAGYETAQGIIEIVAENQQEKLITLYERKQLCKVTFECKNEKKEILKDVDIIISDNENSKITAQADGTYMLVKGRGYVCIASKAGYEEEILRFKAEDSDNAKQEITMKEVDRTVEFEIKDSRGKSLEAADVMLKDKSGNVVEPFKADRLKYNLGLYEDYSYTVSCNGFADKTGAFSVEKSRALTIVLEDKKTEVRFNFKDGDNALTGVSLSVYGEDGTLYRSAGDKYLLPYGSYTYSAAAEDYQAVNGGFEIAAGTSNVEIPMTLQTEGTETEFAGGSGTEEDPYLIATEAQLKALAAKTKLGDTGEITYGYYRLISDVTLTGDWSPIGSYKDENVYNIFSGNFDGGGHTVTITGNRTSDDNRATGLFGAVEAAKISNVTVAGAVTGKEFVGGIAGLVFYHTKETRIENCENEATINSGTAYAGGIVGFVSGTDKENAKINIFIESCSNSGNVTADGNLVGGIIGAGRALRIASCYNSATIKGAEYVGGIQGSTSANTYTYNCYNTGNIQSNQTDKSKKGSISGGSSGNFYGIYALESTSNNLIGQDGGANIEYQWKYSNPANMTKQNFVDLLNIRNEEDRGDFVYSEGNYPLLKWQQQETAKLYAEQPVITTQPAGDRYSIGAKDALLGVTAKSPDGGELTYQWYVNHTADTKYAQKIEGAISDSYTPDTSAEGAMYYYVVVTNTVTDENGKTATNRAVSRFAKVETISKETVREPQITGVTGSGTFEIGAAAELGVTVNSPVGGNISYQWYRSKYADTKGQAIADATGASYTAANETAGIWYYYAAVTNTEGGSSRTVNSDRIKVEVKSKDTSVIPSPGGDGTGGGGVLPLPPVEEEKPPVITVETEVKDDVSQVKVPADKITEALDSLTDSSSDITIEVSDKKNSDEINLEIDMKSAEKLAQKLKGTLITKTADAELTFSKEALENIVKQADEKAETITIIIKRTSAETADGNKELVQIEVKVGDNTVYDFGGKVYVKSDMTVVYPDENGILQITGSEFSDVNSIDNPAADTPVKPDVKGLIKEMKIKTSVKKTGKSGIRVKASTDVSEIKAAGYTVKYRYYRSVKKSSSYKAMKTKSTTTYINTTGKKGTKYYYKVRVYVYDEGKLVAKTALKQSNAAAIKK